MRTHRLSFFGLPLLWVSLASCQLGGSAWLAHREDCREPIAIRQGAVAGRSGEQGTCSWKGIPYADSGPAYRFKRPGPAPAWTGVREAGKFSPDCLQGVLAWLSVDTAEQCMHLNLWRPRQNETRHNPKLPVMVFLHGGAYTLGGSSWDVYDGAALAREGVVLITVNYRMGPLGFMASPESMKEDPAGGTGNWGIWDPVAALQWVHDNVAAFGGDPANVTIFGESAGAWSVCTLMAVPQAQGLFKRALMQSGGCRVSTLEEQLRRVAEYTKDLGCGAPSPSLACLRKLDAKASLNPFLVMWKGASPTVDGVVLKDQPFRVLEKDFPDVDLLVGSNRNEVKPLNNVPSLARQLEGSAGSMVDRLANGFSPADAARFRQLYPPRNFRSGADVWEDVSNDLKFHCESAWSAARGIPGRSWLYVLDLNGTRGWGEKTVGTFHSMEISPLFNRWEVLRLTYINDEAINEFKEYGKVLRAQWAAFARTGNPNGPGLPAWRPYSESQGAMRLNPSRPGMEAGYHAQQCAFWAKGAPDTLRGGVMAEIKLAQAAGLSAVGDLAGLSEE